MTGRRQTRALMAVIALQVLVPLFALLSGPPARFGFQMFAGYEKGHYLVAQDNAGGTIQFEEKDLWHVPLRPELDWTNRIPEHVCLHVANVAIVVVYQGGVPKATVACS